MAYGYLPSRRASPPFGRCQSPLSIEAHGCGRLAQGCYPTARRPGIELTTENVFVEAYRACAKKLSDIASLIHHMEPQETQTRSSATTERPRDELC